MRYFPDGYLKNPSHPLTVDVIGCGGTGSFVVSRLARINHALLQLGHLGLHVRVFDDDKVEKHNVGRQNFSIMDVGEYKSICIVEKCNIVYGTNWEAFNEKHPGDSVDCNVMFICVDNVNFRKLINDLGRSLYSNNLYRKAMYLIDCGNGKDFGQVVLSDFTNETLKTSFDLFPDIMTQDNEKFQKTNGCSYAEKLEEQSLFINDFISAEACNLFWEMINSDFIENQGVIINQKTMKKSPIKIDFAKFEEN